MDNLYKAFYIFTKEVDPETKEKMINDWWNMRKPWVKITNGIIPMANRIAKKLHLSGEAYDRYIFMIYKPVSFVVNLCFSSKSVSKYFGGDDLDFYVKLKTDEDVVMHVELVKV